jgi:hypothetical protein
MKDEILNCMREFDKIISTSGSKLFRAALAFYMRYDTCVVEKMNSRDIDDMVDYIDKLGSILNEDLCDKIDEMIGDVV